MMRTCGSCKYWSGHFTIAYIASCLFSVTKITEKLELPKHVALDSPACEHWKQFEPYGWPETVYNEINEVEW